MAESWAILPPPPPLTISQWADRYRYIPPEAAAEPGPWDTSRAEYMRGVMDAISDPAFPTIVCIKSAQVGWTEAILNACAYHIHLDPAPILVIQPSIEMAESWSKDRLAPMVRDTPAIRNLVSDPKSRDTENTLRFKSFPGGRLSIVGANSPRGLAMRPVRMVLADEIDGYRPTTEGDALALAAKRQITFWNRKLLLGSTPGGPAEQAEGRQGSKRTSIVWREWLRSDQRRYYVPCPHCDHAQTLRWEQVRWDKPDGRDDPETAHYVCEECGAIWNDPDRWDAVKRGRWKAEGSGAAGAAGFHIPGFLSPWLTLAQIVREFLAAQQDPNLKQVWVNTVLGEPYDEDAEKIESAGLLARGESYGPQSVPDAVKLITAGIDVQRDRVEAQVIGWGAREESWVVDYEIFRGDVASAELWREVDAFLLERYRTDAGRELRIRATCIDAGDGSNPATAVVLAFCRARRGRRVFATKGAATARPIWPRRASRTRNKLEDIFIIGVNTAKDLVYGRIMIGKPGPGYIHFPTGGPFDQAYFDQLTSEQVQTKYKNGKPYREWFLPPKRRNEALDTFVLALAARMSIPLRLDLIGAARRPEAAEVQAPIEPPGPDQDVIRHTAFEPPPQGPGSGVRHSGFSGGGWMAGRRSWWDRE